MRGTNARRNTHQPRKVEAMNSAANISALYFVDPTGRVAKFMASRAYGVLNAAKTHAIGRRGIPCTWDTKRVAAECAPYADGFTNHQWVPVFATAEAARASI